MYKKDTSHTLYNQPHINSHFLEEDGLRVGVLHVLLAHGRSGAEEVDSQVGVVALHRLGDVLDGGDVERSGDAVHRQDDGLVLLVCRRTRTGQWGGKSVDAGEGCQQGERMDTRL